MYQWRIQKIQKRGNYCQKWTQKFQSAFQQRSMWHKFEWLIVRKKLSSIRSSYTFLNTLIRANSFFIKSIIRSFVILNPMMENEQKSFTNISIFSGSMVADHCRCAHDLRKEIVSNSITFVFVFRHNI